MKIFKKLFFKVIVFYILFSVFYPNNGICLAQDSIDSGQDLKHLKDTLEYYQMEEKLEKKKTEEPKENIEVEQDESISSPDGTEVIQIARIETNKSDILTQEEISSVTDKYKDKTVSIKELAYAAQEFNRLYKQKNILTAKAILPPQRIENGVVKIQLIEGHLEGVTIDGNKYTRNSYILERINLKSGHLLRLDKLEEQLSYFNMTNDVKIKAELKSGQQFATTQCLLKVQEPKNYQTAIFMDNAGRKETGISRQGLTLQINSLLGVRDVLTLVGIRADGSSGGSIAYKLPIFKKGTRLGISYDINSTKVMEGNFTTLDIRGHSWDFALSLTHPLAVKPTRRLEGNVQWHNKSSNTESFGLKLAESNVKTLVTGLSMQWSDKIGFWYSNLDLTLGHKDKGEEKNFSKSNIFLLYRQLVKKNTVFTFRGSAQLTGSSFLPSTEQFSLGGISSVRGYKEAFVSGDKGYFASGELEFLLDKKQRLKGFIFFDHGSCSDSSSNKDYLTSTGAGMNISIAPETLAKITLGLPLSKKEENKPKINFFLQIQF